MFERLLCISDNDSSLLLSQSQVKCTIYETSANLNRFHILYIKILAKRSLKNRQNKDLQYFRPAFRLVRFPRSTCLGSGIG